MSFAQVKPFNQAQGGTTPNMCLANVTKGYGIPNRYASAWQAWENTQRHGGDAPGGLDVPVYFSYFATIDGQYKNWGHIGVRLTNGQFWSDGKVYSSIGAYTANHSPKYVGWGESVNNVTVIKQGASNMITKQILEIMMGAFFGASPTQADIDNWVGKNELDNMVWQFENDQRRKNYYAQVQKGFTCLKNPPTPGFTEIPGPVYKKTS